MAKLGMREINKNLSRIHEGFYYFKKDTDYCKYLTNFRFNEMGLSPFSDSLDQVLSMMENSDILATSNPTYETYSLNVAYLNKQFDEFASTDQQVIEAMAAKLKEYIEN